MDFRYGAAFGIEPPEAYERLLLDAMLGDSTLFTRRDEVEAQWEFITPILEGWAAEAETQDHPPARVPETRRQREILGVRVRFGDLRGRDVGAGRS